jgi:uncharacterized protein
MYSNEQIIEQTRNWVIDVVIGCNFCPFAANVVKQDKIHYRIEESNNLEKALTVVLQEAARLDADAAIETTLIIFSTSFSSFSDYLKLVSLAEQLLKENKYEGIYQLASFHPEYKFAGTNEADPANYTNRSLYPMLHLLREESIEKALTHYKNPEDIPERNIAFTKEKGLAAMKVLREACF